MKKAVAMLFAGLLAASAYTAVYADCGGKMHKRHDKMIGRMEKSLGLTAEQKEKVSAAMEEAEKKTKEAMAAVKENVSAIREEADKKIREVLTPEQTVKYDAMRQKTKEKMEKRAKKDHCRD